MSSLFEALIGAVVLLVAGIFLFFAYSNSGLKQEESYEVFATFSNVDGLSNGSDVKISGIKVGSVAQSSLDSQNFQAKLKLLIRNDIVIPLDSSAKITTEGLIGNSYLAIEPGGDINNIKPGGIIKYTQDAIDIMGLIGRSIFGSGGNAPVSDPKP